MNMNPSPFVQRLLPTALSSVLTAFVIFVCTVDMCFAGNARLVNLINAPDIQTFLLKVIDILLVFALPIIILFIMYAGYLYVTAKGNASKIEEAHSALLWAVIGGVIVLGARVIFTVINGTVRSL